MNICIAVKILTHPNGGVCTHIIDLCRYYSSQGHKVVLLADGNDYNDVTDTIKGLEYIEMPFDSMGSNPAKIISIFNKFKKICKRNKIEIIHMHGQCIIPIAWLCRLTMGIPFIWTNHINAIPQPKTLAMMHRLMKFPVISVSDELKKDLVDRLNFKDENLFVVYNGVDFNAYPPLTEKERSSLCKFYNIKDDEIVIAELARLTHVKGQHLLVKAVDILQQKYPDKNFHLLFAGTGDNEWFEKNVMQFAKAHNIKTDYLGFQRPRDVFGIASVSVLPSFYEGFPLTVLESLAMECPSIRSNTPGWSSQKEYCLIFSKGDLDGLIDCLEKVIIDYSKWKNITLSCQSEIRHKFSKEEMGKNTLEIYKKFIK